MSWRDGWKGTPVCLRSWAGGDGHYSGMVASRCGKWGLSKGSPFQWPGVNIFIQVKCTRKPAVGPIAPTGRWIGNLCSIRMWGFPSLLCVISILASCGIFAPWFPQLSDSVVGCWDARCCHTVPHRLPACCRAHPQGTGLLIMGLVLQSIIRVVFILYSSVCFHSVTSWSGNPIGSKMREDVGSYRLIFIPTRMWLRKTWKSTEFLQFLLMAFLSLLCSHLLFPRAQETYTGWPESFLLMCKGQSTASPWAFLHPQTSGCLPAAVWQGELAGSVGTLPTASFSQRFTDARREGAPNPCVISQVARNQMHLGDGKSGVSYCCTVQSYS